MARPGVHHGELAPDQLLHLRVQGPAGVAFLEPGAHGAVIGTVQLDQRRVVAAQYLVDVAHRFPGGKQLVTPLLHQRIRFGTRQHQRALIQNRYAEYRSQAQVLRRKELAHGREAVSIGRRLPTSGSPGARGMVKVETEAI